ncbi:MAG: hypothetical protein ACLQIK_01965 [Mycobacterium sp.]|uniref:hypothetical protein n=1 Tax=Mycobacterium sp. TaxID=1785 RepID=UPI003F9C1F90
MALTFAGDVTAAVSNLHPQTKGTIDEREEQADAGSRLTGCGTDCHIANDRLRSFSPPYKRDGDADADDADDADRPATAADQPATRRLERSVDNRTSSKRGHRRHLRPHHRHGGARRCRRVERRARIVSKQPLRYLLRYIPPAGNEKAGSGCSKTASHLEFLWSG